MLLGLVSNNNSSNNILDIMSHQVPSNNSCVILRNGDAAANITIKLKLPKLSKYCEYVKQFKNLYFDEIQLKIGGQLCQSFTSDYLIATKHKTFQDDEYIYIPIPFQLHTTEKQCGLPLVALQLHEVRVNLKCASKNKIINVKYGCYIKLENNNPNAELIVSYVYFNSPLRRQFAEMQHQFNFTTINTQTEKIDVGFDKNINIYKRYLSFKFPKDIVNYLCLFLDKNHKGLLDHEMEIKLKDYKNVLGLILTVTDDDPDEVRMKDNEYRHYKYIEEVKMIGNGHNMLIHNKTQLYYLSPYLHNNQFTKNVAYVPFTTKDIGGITGEKIDMWNLNIKFKLNKPKYGNYVLNIHYICHVESMIKNGQWYIN